MTLLEFLARVETAGRYLTGEQLDAAYAELEAVAASNPKDAPSQANLERGRRERELADAARERRGREP